MLFGNALHEGLSSLEAENLRNAALDIELRQVMGRILENPLTRLGQAPLKKGMGVGSEVVLRFQSPNLGSHVGLQVLDRHLVKHLIGQDLRKAL